MVVPEGVVHTHVRAHSADLIPVPVLPQLLGKLGPSLWRDLTGVDQHFPLALLALPGSSGDDRHGRAVMFGGGWARSPGPGTLGCRSSEHSNGIQCGCVCTRDARITD